MSSNNSALIVPPPAPATTAVTNDICDIKPPVTVPTGWAWAWWVLGAVVLLAAVAAWWAWWRKRPTRAAPASVTPPHVRAKHKLSGALALLHDPRLFCILVSDTLRIYLEERFQVHAPERTTEEFLVELQHTMVLNVDQKQRLEEFLEKCDLVKFAQFEPTEKELRDLLEAALRLIDETQYEYAPLPGGSGVPRPAISPVPMPQTPVSPSEVSLAGAKSEAMPGKEPSPQTQQP